MWRVAEDGSGTLVAQGDALGVPLGFGRYLHGGSSFHVDTARRTPVWLFSTYDAAFGQGLLLGAWNGQSFAPIPQENGIQVASSDSFVFDPVRGVLVHFAGTRDMDGAIDAQRSARGGLTVRELGADGVWRDVGEPLAGAWGRAGVAVLPQPWGIVAYDSGCRVLVVASESSLAEVAIGEALDAAATGEATGEAEEVSAPGEAEGAAGKGSAAKGSAAGKGGAAAKGGAAKGGTAAKSTTPKPEAVASAVWLRLQEGESDKFWFVLRKGTAWIARWGRRGGKASEKGYTFESTGDARVAYEKAVREKLAKGYEHAPEQEAAAMATCSAAPRSTRRSSSGSSERPAAVNAAGLRGGLSAGRPAPSA
ncbi:WGR domain-containing protein [Chondromyces apiculatus]|uniref:WGR domain-containing protein n=1 Tax=Chondromyces apiculatus DSM 436 TaxID=1192034 RepID=A0A017TJ05_9BACT|nr:WGR domain-containing protein [Chondromyces apiculatus]EYF08830.1 Hypothetical protein CAP_2691 [Chondromyces apiculatus DSM 436]